MFRVYLAASQRAWHVYSNLLVCERRTPYGARLLKVARYADKRLRRAARRRK